MLMQAMNATAALVCSSNRTMTWLADDGIPTASFCATDSQNFEQRDQYAV
jgi:hypothetical protein